MPDLVIVQLDAAAALAGELGTLGAELAADGARTRTDGLRLGRALSGPAAEELTATGQGWAGLVETLATRAQTVSGALTEALASYRSLDTLVAERMGAGPTASTAR